MHSISPSSINSIQYLHVTAVPLKVESTFLYSIMQILFVTGCSYCFRSIDLYNIRVLVMDKKPIVPSNEVTWDSPERLYTVRRHQ